MGYQLLSSDLGVTAYEVVGESATYVGKAANALDTITAAKPLSPWTYLVPPLAFLKLTNWLTADLNTAGGRAAAKAKLLDLHGRLADAANTCAELGQAAIGAANAAAWNQLLTEAEAVGSKVTTELQRVDQAAAPIGKVLEAPEQAIQTIATGTAQGVTSVATGVGWFARHLGWIIGGAVVLGVGVLLLIGLPQRWVRRHRKEK